MLLRYSRPEMTALWEAENRFRIWLEIEILAAEKMAELGLIPPEVPEVVRSRAERAPELILDTVRIDQIEQETRHDVIAFLTNLAEHVGPEARYLHQGMTSSDVLDTCFAVQLTEATDLLLHDIEILLTILDRRAHEFKDTIMIGRSHGIHAEPITFGLKLA
ncbi:MAG: lyase family protein, partial [Alphaproteobacteria bacterium]|nr:lyase family protein [Alphaproteobacteria bacterium]